MKDEYKIGVIKFTDHASLNRIEAGVKICLDRLGEKYGVKMNYDGLIFNGAADTEKMKEAGRKFADEKVDLVVSIATPPTVAIKDILARRGINMYFYAVSDPITAGVIDSWEHPGKYVTGMSDALDGKLLCSVMLKIKPDVRKVGLLYDTAQISSKMPVKDIKEYLESAGIEYIESNPTCRDEVKPCAEYLISQGADAVVTPTDNTVMSAELIISPILTRAGIPQFTGSHAFVLNGAFCGLGGYYTSGDKRFYETAEKLLIEGVSPNDIPVIRGSHGFAAINRQICEKLGCSERDIENSVSELGIDTIFMDSEKEFDPSSKL